LLKERALKQVKALDAGDVAIYDRDKNAPLRTTLPQVFRLYLALSKYFYLRRRARGITAAGFSGLAREFSMPFSEWLAKRKLGMLEAIFAPVVVPCGYGYLNEIPAAYALKLLNPACVLSTIRHDVALIEDGYQTLVEAIAKRLDVRLGSAITTVRRDGRVNLTVNGTTAQFDKVVFTCPLDGLRTVLDCDREECDLFNRIEYYDYSVIAARVTGLPCRYLAYTAKTLDRRHQGQPLVWFRRWADSDLVTVYALPAPGQSDEEVEALARRALQQLGGTVEEVVSRKRWKYFPHFSPSAFEEGCHDRLEARQGYRNSYFAGEIMGFSSVEHVAQYSKHLVDRFFA
jgi:predicted NAD/FAD-binding protein